MVHPKGSDLTTQKILEDFEQLFDLAMASDNLALAVKIKELQGKYLGMFEGKRSRSPELTPLKTLQEMSDEQLVALLEGKLKTDSTTCS